METTKEAKVRILADLWLNYRNDEEFKDFVEYNDLGLPLSYAVESKIVSSNDSVEQFVLETFDLLLAGLGIEDDGFESLEEILGFQ